MCPSCLDLFGAGPNGASQDKAYMFRACFAHVSRLTVLASSCRFVLLFFPPPPFPPNGGPEPRADGSAARPADGLRQLRAHRRAALFPADPSNEASLERITEHASPDACLHTRAGRRSHQDRAQSPSASGGGASPARLAARPARLLDLPPLDAPAAAGCPSLRAGALASRGVLSPRQRSIMGGSPAGLGGYVRSPRLHRRCLHGDKSSGPEAQRTEGPNGAVQEHDGSAHAHPSFGAARQGDSRQDLKHHHHQHSIRFIPDPAEDQLSASFGEEGS